MEINSGEDAWSRSATAILILVNQALAIDAFLAITSFREVASTETSHVTKAVTAASGVS